MKNSRVIFLFALLTIFMISSVPLAAQSLDTRNRTLPNSDDVTKTILEDTPWVFGETDFPFSDPSDGDTFAAVMIDDPPSEGTINFQGLDVDPSDFPIYITVTSLGDLIFTPELDGNGLNYANFPFRVQDSAGEFSASHTFRFNVTAVNDDPVLFMDGDLITDPVNLDIAIFEDGFYTFTQQDSIRVDDVDIINKDDPDTPIIVNMLTDHCTITIDRSMSRFISGNGTANVTIVTTINQINSYLEDFSLHPVDNYSGPDTLTFRINDQGNIGQGGGDDVNRYIGFMIEPVNDAPILYTNYSASLTTIPEDDYDNDGDLIEDIINPGAIYDPDGSTVIAIAVIGVDNSDGLWQYSTTDGATWDNFTDTIDSSVNISSSAVLLDGTLGLHRIRFVPESNYNGYANFTFRAWDRSEGIAGSVFDIVTVGDTTAFSLAYDTAQIKVQEINDNPEVFYKSTMIDSCMYIPLEVDEDLNYHFTQEDSLRVWDPDVGSNQLIVNMNVVKGVLDFEGNSRFISGDGTNNVVIVVNQTNMNNYLRNFNYISNPGAAGMETLTIIMNDQGFTGQGTGVNIERKIYFALTNDPPVFTSTPTLSVFEDELYQYNITAEDDTVSVCGIHFAAPVKPAWLSLTDNGDGTAILQGTPSNEYIGYNQVTLTVRDDIDDPVQQVFNIEVINVNDPPEVANPIPNQVALEDFQFNFQFAANTFMDPDPNDALTYSAALADNDPLPEWLSFNPENRLFSGLPVNTDIGVYQIAVTAMDILEETVIDTFRLTVQNTNDAPYLVSEIPDQLTQEQDLYNYTLPDTIFADDDPDDVLTYSATLQDLSPLPAWLDFDPATKTFSGTPVHEDIGQIYIRVQVEDLDGATASDVFRLWVTWINIAPQLANPISDRNATEDAGFIFTFPDNTFTDENIPEGDILTYSAVKADDELLPTWLQFNPNTRTFTGIPRNEDVGTLSVKVIATDVPGLTAEDIFDISIANTNDPPFVANIVPNQIAIEDQYFEFTFADSTFGDPDAPYGDTFTYSAEQDSQGVRIPLPEWLSFDGPTRTFTGTPANEDRGNWNIKLTAQDVAGLTATTTFRIEVLNTNDGPVVLNPILDHHATEDIPYTFTFSTNVFGDPDNEHQRDILTYSAELASGDPLPNWLSFTPELRTFTGIPLNNNVGIYEIAVTATDTAFATATDTFQLEVENVNDAPVLVNPIPNQITTETLPYSYTFAADTFADDDVIHGDFLTYSAGKVDEGSLVALPVWLSFDPATRTFSGTPQTADIGIFDLRVTATDSSNVSVTDDFLFEVRYFNQAPTVANPIPNQNGSEDTLFDYTFPIDTFFDTNVGVGDTLFYSATLTGGDPLPEWLTFTPTARNFNGMPLNENVGNYTIVVTARDRSDETATDEFVISIANVNDAPYVANSIPAQTATEDAPFTFTVPANTFGDDDLMWGDVLTLSATLEDDSALPAWLSFNAATNAFSGTPTVPGIISIKVTATDTSDETTFTVFTLEILNTQDDPYFLTSPVLQATEDALYTYNIEVADDDPGNVLQIGYDLLPSWLTLNDNGDNTGVLEGTPLNANVGPNEVILTVNDGVRVISTQEFTITVTNVNDAPYVANPIANKTVAADMNLDYTFAENAFLDDDLSYGDELTYTATLSDGSDLPAWVTFDGATRHFGGMPALSDVATYEVRVTASDIAGEEVFDDFDLIVIPYNQAPEFTTTPPLDATEGVLYTYNINTSDDGIDDGIFINGNTVPEWLTLTDNGDGTALLEGTPTNDNVGANEVVLAVSDNIAPDVIQNFTITVANVNNAPQVVNPIADQDATQDQFFQFTFGEDVFADIDAADALTYSAQLQNTSPLPAWLSFNAATRTFSGTPANSDVGTYDVAVIATDLEGASGTDVFTLTVANVNDAPYVLNQITLVIGWEDVAFNYTFPSNTFSDPDLPYGDVLTYSATLDDGSPLPEWLTLTSATRRFSGLPSDYDTGNYTIRLIATDIAGESVYDDFTLTINNFNDAPSLVNPIPDQAAFVDTPFDYTFPIDTFNDPDPGDFLNYSAQLTNGSPLPGWLTFDDGDRRFYGTPAGIAPNTEYQIRVTAMDAAMESAYDIFKIVVFSSNEVPYFVSTPITEATQDIPYVYNIEAEDDSVNFGITIAAPVVPEWLTFSDLGRGSASLSGTPTNDNIGLYDVTLTVWDHIADPVEQSFTIEVINVNDAPQLVNAIPDQVSQADVAYSYMIPAGTFIDIDAGDVLTYSASLYGGDPLPSWLTFDDQTLTFSGTPQANDIAIYNILVTATDLEGAMATDVFELNIVPSNYPPEFISTPVTTAFEDALYQYNVVTTDDGVNNGGIVIAAPTAPAWLSLQDNGDGTALLSGTPDNSLVGLYNIVLTLSDGISPVIEQSFSINVINTNDAPVLVNPISDHVTYENAAYSFSFAEDTFEDDDIIYGDALAYSATLASGDPLPGWMSFIPSQRMFSGIPANEDVGTYSIEVTATDLAGRTATDVFELQVLNVNTPPYVENPLPDQAAIALTPYQFIFSETTFGDDDLIYGDALTYSARQTSGEPLPEWLSFDAANRMFSGTAPIELLGTTYIIRVTARDSQLESVYDDFELTIIDSNDPPVFTSTPVEDATEDVLYTYIATATDSGPNFGLVFLASDLPEWLSLVNNGGGSATISGTPDNEDVGTHNIDIVVTDGIADPVHQVYTLTVQNSNDAPYVANPIPNQAATEGEAFVFTFAENTFGDDDIIWGDMLGYSAELSDGSLLPAWLGFSELTRTFSGTPGDNDVATLEIKVIATDNLGATVAALFTLEVINSGDSPVFTSTPVVNATEDALYQYNVVAEDSDPDAVLVLAAPQLPEWLTLTDNGDGTGLLQGTPLNENVGANNVVITANDGTRVLATQSFTITVANTNDIPYVANPIPNQAAMIDQSYDYIFPESTFGDDDLIHGDVLTYTATLSDGSALPAWLSFAPLSRYFTGTPGLSDIGTYTIRVTATDTQLTSVSDDFDLQVIDSNIAPSFTSTPITAAIEGVPYQYDITTTDDGVNLGISISAPQLPLWLDFTDHNDGTATLSGTPNNEDVGNHTVLLTVSDGIAAPVTQMFNINVANINTPPVLINPIADQAALIHQNFLFVIPEDTFTDADEGDVLTYTATLSSGNPLPAWLIFDAEEHRFSGLPSAANIGTYSIRVIVTDTGNESASDNFTISVYAEDVPPVFTSLPVTEAYENIPYVYDIRTRDDGINLGITINATTLPAWLNFTDNGDGTAVLSGTPAATDQGLHNVVLNVTDNILPPVWQEFTIEVYDVNQSPVLVNNIPDQTTVTEELFSYIVPENTFSDPDPTDVLTWSAELSDGNDLPAWLAFNQDTRELQGTPAITDAGFYYIRVTVTDQGDLSAADIFLLRVFTENQPPAFISMPLEMIDVDHLYTYEVETNDDGNNFGGIVIEAPVLPEWLALYDNEDGTATLTGTPSVEHTGPNAVVLTVSDGIAAPVEQAFSILVNELNHPPYVAIPLSDQFAIVNTFFSYTVDENAFVDPDQGDALTYEIMTVDGSPAPAWLTIDNATRTISGTPQPGDEGITPIRVEVTDNLGETAYDDFNLRVITSNLAPVFASSPVEAIDQDSRYTYEIFVTDDNINLNGIEITTNELPEWLSFNDFGNGVAIITGVPANENVGAYNIIVYASDGIATPTEQAYTLTVNNVNDAPYLSNPNENQFAYTNQYFEFSANSDTFEDPDAIYGDQIIYRSSLIDGSPLPSWLIFNPDGLTYSGTPSEFMANLYTIKLTAFDQSGASASDLFDLTIRPYNSAPEFVSTPVTEAWQNSLYTYNVVAEDDAINAGLTIVDGVIPAWLTLVDNGDGTAVLSGTPANGDVGEEEIVLYVSDGIIREASSQQFTLTIYNVNDAPYVANEIPDLTTAADAAFEYTIPENTFDDPDLIHGDHLTYSAMLTTREALPDWLTFDGTTRTFSGTPMLQDSGDYSISVTATDDAMESATDIFTLQVFSGNLPPEFTSTPVTEVDEDALYTYNITTEDDGVGFGVQISASILPAWLTLTDNGDGTALLTGTPENANVGDHQVVLQASDNVRVVTEQEFVITVNNVNDTPYLINPIADVGIRQGVMLDYEIPEGTFGDDDIMWGDVLTWSAKIADGSVLPAWLIFDPATHTFTGMPDLMDVGLYDTRVTVTDEDGAFVYDDFVLTVYTDNMPPTFTSTPVTTATEDVAYIYNITTTDDGFSEEINITGVQIADWLTLTDNGNGTAVLQGTPTNDNVGSFPITIRVDDGIRQSTDQSFTLEVQNVNDAPYIANPIRDHGAVIETLFSFTFAENTFGDDDIIHGDVLTYSADLSDGNPLPAWLTFDAANREFSGTPTLSDVGIYNVRVTATDVALVSAEDVFMLRVVLENNPPQFASEPVLRVNEGELYSYAITVTDDGTNLGILITAPVLPEWLTLTDNGDGTALLSGTPTWQYVGANAVTLNADDGITVPPTEQSFSIEVLDVNSPPFVQNAIPNQTATQDMAFSYTFPENTFGDLDGDALTYNAIISGDGELPLWLTFDAVTRNFSGTPTNDNVGELAIDLIASDPAGQTATASFVLTVANLNDAPYLVHPIQDHEIYELTSYSFTFRVDTFYDPDILWGDVLTYEAQLSDGSALPEWLEFTSETRSFNGIPTHEDVGTYVIRVIAIDEEGLQATDEFNLRVLDEPDAPYVANPIPDQDAWEDAAFSYTFPENTFADIDVNNTLTYSALLENGDPLPVWLRFNDITRNFNGLPTQNEVGSYAIAVTATDIYQLSATDVFILTVHNTNDMPYFTSTPDTTAVEAEAYAYNIVVEDIDVMDNLTFTAITLPSWLTLTDNGNGTALLAGTPYQSNIGDNPVVISVADSTGVPVDQSFVIHVQNVVEPPVVSNSIPDQSTFVNLLYNYTFPVNTFIEPTPGDVLTYTATQEDGSPLPAWLTFDPATRNFNGTPDAIATWQIKVIATDLDLQSVEDVFMLDVVFSQEPPFFTSTPVVDATEDALYTYNITASDINLEALSFSGVTIPAWLTLTDNGDNTATLTGTPLNENVGENAVEITVTDGINDPMAQSFIINVANVNDAPYYANAIPNQEAHEDMAFEYTFPENTFLDDDLINGDVLTYTSTLDDDSALPAWLGFDPATRTYSGMPVFADIGTYNVKVIATDIENQTAEGVFVITVVNSNDAPYVMNPIADQNAIEDTPFSFTFAADTFDDEDFGFGDVLSYTSTQQDGDPLPAWLSFDNATRAYSGMPENADIGTWLIRVTATDIGGLTAFDDFEIVVTNTQDDPYFVSAPVTTATEDVVYTYNIVTNDVDPGATLILSADVLPTWLTLTDNGDGTGNITGTPLNENVGTNPVTLTVSDGVRVVATQIFDIEVANSNDAPYVMNPIPDQTATEDAAFSFAFADDTFGDDDIIHGDALTYSAQQDGGDPLPAWLSFDAATRTFSGTPTNDDIDTYSIAVIAEDIAGASATDVFVLTVENTQDDPYFVSEPVTTATEDAVYTYNIETNDVDPGATLVLGADVLPTWLTLTDNGDGTGNITGTPLNENVGTNPVTLTVSDGVRVVATQIFDIEVANSNDAPYVMNPIADQNAIEDELFSFTFADDTFGDDDFIHGDALTYSAQQDGGDPLPAWLSFDAATRTFSGTPTNDDIDTYSIAVIAEDIAGATATDVFILTVENTQDDPYFVSEPVTTATEDAVYTYNIETNDVDPGATLVLGADVLPTWLTLTDNGDGTGDITGTPLNENVGTNPVTLTVSDGVRVVATQIFDIEVANVNDAPYVANVIPDQTATEDAAFSFAFADDTFGDDDIIHGDALTYSAEQDGGDPLPAWLSFDAATRTFSGTPTNDDLGTYQIAVTAEDNAGATATDVFQLTVNNTNDAPYFTSTPLTTATEDVVYTYDITADDDDPNDDLDIIATILPTWLTLTDNGNGTATLEGTPLNENVGDNEVGLEVHDGITLDIQSFTIVVTNVNDAPYVANEIPDQSTDEDAAFSYTFAEDTFGDDDLIHGDVLTYTAAESDGSELPAWLSFDAATRTFSGTPTNDDLGTYMITVMATDEAGASATDTFNIEVINTNDAPYFTSTPVLQINEDENYSYAIAFNDDDPNPVLTITMTTGPEWLTLTQSDNTSAVLEGTPTNANVGDNDVVLVLDDGINRTSLKASVQKRDTAMQAFTITVINVNDAPYVANPVDSLQINENEIDQSLDLNNMFSDDDLIWGDVLTYSYSGNIHIVVGINDGIVSLDPETDWYGTETITFYAEDNDGATAQQDVVITVINIIDVPVIDPIDAQVVYNINTPWTFTVTGEFYPVAEYSLVDPPAGMTIDGETGVMSWTPTAEQTNLYEITVHLQNDAGFDEKSFSFTVINQNDAPRNLTPELFNDGSTLTWSAPVSSKWLAGYNVYRSNLYDDEYELLAELGADATQYIDENPVTGANNFYKVAAVLQVDHIDWTGESTFSVITTVYPLPVTEFSLFYDDGTSEQGYGQGNEFGVQFDLSPIQRYTPTSTLIKFAIYLETLDTQDLLINLYGDGDTPTNENYITAIDYAAGDLHLGWNVLDVPADLQPEFVGGRFHVVVDYAHPYQVGFDTGDPISGHSYVDGGTGWGAITTGDLMIRAIVATPLPNIAVDVTSMNFGDVFAGEESDPQMFTIENTGNYELVVSEIGAPPGFQIRHGTDGGWVQTLSLTIPYQGSEDFYVKFTPSTRQVYTGEIEIVHNGVDETDVNITVRGNSIEPQPNAFSPNGDGLNDTYTVRLINSGNIDATMNIYDLHGKRVRDVKGVYDGTGMSLSWDGKNDGGSKCISGPYIYVLRKNGSIEKRGKIYLIR